MSSPKSYLRALSAIALLACLFAASRGRAQTCHPPSLRDEPADSGFHVGFVSVAATFSDTEHGDYQGIIPTASWHYESLTAEVAVPWYRLQRNADEDIGLGDLTADVRVAIYRTPSRLIAFGPELAASFPTGDADKELGMGHVMLMPGVWGRLELARLSIIGQLAWGRALADTDQHAGHHMHHGGAAPHASPRVNPMNMNELEHALGLRYAVHPNLALTARWLGAIPLEDDGFERQTIGPGLQLTADALDASIEAQVPVAGDPFDVRFMIAFGAQL
jgi:hypothetical protein